MSQAIEKNIPRGQKKASDDRLPFLDVIRGVAASAVVIEHSCEQYYPSYLPWANSHFTIGVFGVAAFFLVSGFIIPVSMERHKSLLDFWEARFFRLYPMYWFSILCTIALWFTGHSTGDSPLAHSGAWELVLANLTMLQSFMGIASLATLFWTLTMELVFYFLSSALFLAGLLSRTLLWVWVAAVGNLAANLVLGLFFHQSIPAGRAALIISALFGTLLYRHCRGSASLSSILKVLPVLAVSLACGFWFRFQEYPSSSSEDSFRFGAVILSYAAAYLVFVLFYWRRETRFAAAFIWLGRISYSLYLMHGFVLAAIPTGSHPLLRSVLVFAASVALSSITFVWIEKPALALYRRISKRPKALRVVGFAPAAIDS